MDWKKTQIWSSIQPILRETGDDEFPYSISGGTIFLLTYQGRTLAVTARHVLFPLTSICLFPTDLSQKILPLEKVFYIPDEMVEDDYSDFVIIEIDMMKAINHPEFSLLKLIDFEKVSRDWLLNPLEEKFFVLGYPLEHSKIEPSEKSIITARYILQGNYRGISEHSNFVHTLKISNDSGVSDFNGFSGSPVFACRLNKQKYNEIAFCGMAIRGSSRSRLIHFVDREVILAGIRKKTAPYCVTRKSKNFFDARLK